MANCLTTERCASLHLALAVEEECRVLFLNDWAAIMMVSQNAVNAPLSLDVDDVFVADSGDISAHGGFMISRQSLRINSPQLAQRPLV